MSVINNVLKDLESRASQFTPIDIAAVDHAVAKKQPKSRLSLVLLSGVIVLSICGVIYYLTLGGQIESIAVRADNVPEPALPAAKIVRNEQPAVMASEQTLPQPNQIIGLQINETTEQLSLEFLLREKAISYLKERSENSFIYHLKNIESAISAPLMKDNQWIDKLSINKTEQGIDVTFKTASDVLVSTEQSQKLDDTVWIIRLQKQQAAVSIARPEIATQQPVETVKTETITTTISDVADDAEIAEPIDVSESRPVKMEIKSAGQELSDSGQLAKATDLVKQRQWKSAETLLLSLIDGPQDMAARKQLLGIYAQPKFSEKYSALARQSSERYPQQGIFKTEYARSLFQAKSYRMAISLLQDLGDQDTRQLALIAASYQRLDQHQNAIEYYRQSLKLNRQQARNWIGLGISLEHEAKLEKALLSYQTAAKLGNINARLQQFVEQRSRMLERVIN